MNIYDKAFRDPDYSPKEDYKVEYVKTWAEQHDLNTLLDVGCGRGHYLKALLNEGFDVIGLEPSKYLCENVLKDFQVINEDILTYAKRNKVEWDGMYCMDVLEHIPKGKIDATLEALKTFSHKALFGIANHSDVVDGTELHLIQEYPAWWEAKLSEHYKSVELIYEPFRYMVFECFQ